MEARQIWLGLSILNIEKDIISSIDTEVVENIFFKNEKHIVLH